MSSRTGFSFKMYCLLHQKKRLPLLVGENHQEQMRERTIYSTLHFQCRKWSNDRKSFCICGEGSRRYICYWACNFPSPTDTGINSYKNARHIILINGLPCLRIKASSLFTESAVIRIVILPIYQGRSLFFLSFFWEMTCYIVPSVHYKHSLPLQCSTGLLQKMLQECFFGGAAWGLMSL